MGEAGERCGQVRPLVAQAPEKTLKLEAAHGEVGLKGLR